MSSQISTVITVPPGLTFVTTVDIPAGPNVPTPFPLTTTLTFPETTFPTTIYISVASTTSRSSSSSQERDVFRTSTSSTSLSATTLSSDSSASRESAQATSKGLSTAAIAGIGVACAAVGAIFALIAAFLLLRRRKKSSTVYSPGNAATSESAYGGGTKIKDLKGIQPTSTTAVDNLSSDRSDDNQIKTSMENLNELIRQHAENHYNNRPFQGQQSDLEADLIRCGYNGRTEPSAKGMVTLIVTPKTRKTAIRQLIAKIILNGTQLESDDETSLLPIYVLAACQAMLAAKHSTNKDQVIFNKSFTKWRRLTSFLVSLSTTTHEADPSLQSAIVANVTVLNCVLHRFINPNAESQRYQRENLAGIITEGAIFGMVLFSQPNVWRFGWDVRSVARRGLVVWPGIGEVVVTGDREDLRVLCEPVSEEI